MNKKLKKVMAFAATAASTAFLAATVGMETASAGTFEISGMRVTSSTAQTWLELWNEYEEGGWAYKHWVIDLQGVQNLVSSYVAPLAGAERGDWWSPTLGGITFDEIMMRIEADIFMQLGALQCGQSGGLVEWSGGRPCGGYDATVYDLSVVANGVGEEPVPLINP